MFTAFTGLFVRAGLENLEPWALEGPEWFRLMGVNEGFVQDRCPFHDGAWTLCMAGDKTQKGDLYPFDRPPGSFTSANVCDVPRLTRTRPSLDTKPLQQTRPLYWRLGMAWA